MTALTDFATFERYAKDYPVVPMYRRLVADSLTPVRAFRLLQQGSPAFLFESVIGGERMGRYSFVGSRPFQRFQAFGKQIEVRSLRDSSVRQLQADDPLTELEKEIGRFRSPTLNGLPRFLGGAVGYAAYDTIRYVEHLPGVPRDDRHLPDLCFDFYEEMVIFDHITKTIYAVVDVVVEPADIRSSYESGIQKLETLVNSLKEQSASEELLDLPASPPTPPAFTSNMTQAQYEEAVRKCKEYILAGDIFQVVLSQRLQAPIKIPAFEVYRALRILNPSPFLFFIDLGYAQLVGSSPEIMARVEGGEVIIRPLAGTRPRGKTAEEDVALEKELLADPKEIAEHVMLVDLGRNDVGRISRFGSVRVTDLLHVERYSHVMHISSTVIGTLEEGKTAFDALRSCLPAGTLSGAPKIRAMEIIDELEPHKRGPYGGAVGYIDFAGSMDTCIALRTMVVQDGIAYVQAGAGIVADSIPQREYQETINKAMGLLRALELAHSWQEK